MTRPRIIWQLVTAAAIAVAMAIAAYWAVTVPILQGPDEDAHFDYAMSIYQAGRLITTRDFPQDPYTLSSRANPFVRFLEDRTAMDLMLVSPEVKAPAGYGSANFYSELDRTAPMGAAQRYAPSQLYGNSFGYYGIAALWMSGVHRVDGDPLALFFGARMLSVLMLGASLLLAWRIMNLLGQTPRRVAGMIAVIGLLPLTTFTSATFSPKTKPCSSAAPRPTWR